MQAIESQTSGHTGDPVVLVVDDEADMQDLFRDIVSPSVGCRMQIAGSIAEARKIMLNHPVSLLVADLMLPDGNGMDLLEDLSLSSPGAGAVLMTSKPAVDQTVSAMRHGVLDFLAKPFNAKQIKDRLTSALHKQAIIARNERRLTRLKTAVRELNKARHTVSQKVDLLCNDLINAYGEISGQFQEVRLTERFRKTIDTANDLEQLLCHAMDWLLKEAGYSNIAIWLSGDEGAFDLGAYMKYTLVGEKKITDALKNTLVQPTVREGLLHLTENEFTHRLSAADRKLLGGQTVMSASCSYLGESLAVIAMFRDGKCPFREDDQTMLKNIASVFAVALATMVRGEDPEEAPDEATPGDVFEAPEPEADEEPKQKPKNKKKKDQTDADWWKRGEPPPF